MRGIHHCATENVAMKSTMRKPSVPRPGARVRGSRTGRPVMALLDLLGRRWCLRVIWELRGDALGFRPLRERCSDLSPTILNRRLAELRESGVVELTEEGYTLTARGRDLLDLLLPLHNWAERWAARSRR